MKYSFKVHVQAHGFAGALIISSTTDNELVKSIRLLVHAGIEPTTAATQPSGSAAVSRSPAPDEGEQVPRLVLLYRKGRRGGAVSPR